ncbi:hypothetical protein J4411_03190 [Candidatus Pacearchaeota archaeon]|nr:hypothetical protein [Candidatus Pacearchaeota archaeon]
MNFIKKIADKNTDESVHLQFQKFSRGLFKNRALINAKKSKEKYTLATGPEFSNELVRVFAEKLGDKKTLVTGAIISTSDLSGKIDFKEIKQFQGVKRYFIETELSGKEMILLLDEFPKVFFALTFSVDENNSLKIKPKAPKSGKPGKGDEEPKADFCKLLTNDSSIVKSFIFEKEDFKTAEIKHDFVVEKIIVPENSEKDFTKIREMAKRSGKIIRYSNIDGTRSVKEYDFEA